MAFPDIRKITYQNPTSGKIYEVVYKRQTNDNIDITAYLLGTNRVNSDPTFDNTRVSAVVITTKIADVFGRNCKADTHLATAAIYDASNRAGVGALLSTLLV